jgi:hypothetical protein
VSRVTIWTLRDIMVKMDIVASVDLTSLSRPTRLSMEAHQLGNLLATASTKYWS